MKKQTELQAERVRTERFFHQRHLLIMDITDFMEEKLGGPWTFEQEGIKLFDAELTSLRAGVAKVYMLYYRIYDNGLRGIEWFLEERGRKYSSVEREFLERWREMKPSCFQAVGQYEQGMIFEDIWSGERYRMPYCEIMPKLPPWSVMISLIEPYGEDWCTHGATMYGHPDIRLEVAERVRQLQAEELDASGRLLAPADILAAHYPEFMNRCKQTDNRLIKASSPTRGEMQDKLHVTRSYHCDHPKLLADRLLELEDQYILVPDYDKDADVAISRADLFDGLFATIPADRQALLGLDEIQISRDLCVITMVGQRVVLSGWWSEELEATIALLDSELQESCGLKLIDEQRETHRMPKSVVLQGFNVLTDRDMSEQEAISYSQLPLQLQALSEQQAQHPELSEEHLVRRREHEQGRANPNAPDMRLLRLALGLPESPFH